MRADPPRTTRTAALAVVLLGAIAFGVLSTRSSPSAALACPPEALRWIDSGSGFIAACADAGEFLPPGVALALGQKLPLNQADVEALALIPGIGKVLARSIIAARGDAGFRSWDEVESVKGVGPAKLDILRKTTALDR